MAARARQSLLVFERRNGTPVTGQGLVIMARTGFQDVTVNGQRFYYNQKQTYNNLGEVNIPAIMNAASNRGKRGIIIISRRK